MRREEAEGRGRKTEDRGRKEGERIENGKEEVEDRGLRFDKLSVSSEVEEEAGDRGAAMKGLAEGDRAIIELASKKKTKFWRRYNGLECFIVSCHRRSAIVEVLKYKELIVCRIENLHPAPQGGTSQGCARRDSAGLRPAGSGRSR